MATLFALLHFLESKFEFPYLCARDSMELKPTNSKYFIPLHSFLLCSRLIPNTIINFWVFYIAENILEQLRNGFARFELVSSPTASVSDSISSTSIPASFLGATKGNSYVFFARIGSSMWVLLLLISS